jgi:altronate dehydratase small subunit
MEIKEVAKFFCFGVFCIYFYRKILDHPSRRLDMAAKSKAVVINEKDNVATAVTPMKSGSTLSLEVQGRAEKIKLLSDIPMGHKFALRGIDEGADVIKYGEPIGRTTAPIAKGEHVHVHNVVSHRGRKEGA